MDKAISYLDDGAELHQDFVFIQDGIDSQDAMQFADLPDRLVAELDRRCSAVWGFDRRLIVGSDAVDSRNRIEQDLEGGTKLDGWSPCGGARTSQMVCSKKEARKW
ncbi:hypothetical protein AB9075_02615 [Burkholderia thailandensis]|uniref:hypothetical protein n=1 Tax=Burkholderia thailandensis TaxID=57975 RepID=UPI003B503B03